MHHANIGMIDGCGGARFPLKVLHGDGISRYFLREKFQGHFPAQFQIFSAIHHAHAARADFFDDPVVRDGAA